MIRDPKRINELAEHILAYCTMHDIKFQNKDKLSIEANKLMASIKSRYNENPQMIEIADGISMIDLRIFNLINNARTHYIENSDGAIAINTSNGVLLDFDMIILNNGSYEKSTISESYALMIESKYLAELGLLNL